VNYYCPSNNHSEVIKVYDIYNKQQKAELIAMEKWYKSTNYHSNQTTGTITIIN